MSATVAAALKKIAVAILTDKKARKVVLGIILGILIILVMPLAAIIAIFNGDINIDANRLQTLVVQNMSAEEQARLQRVEDLMYEIEDKMTEAGFDNQRVKEAQVLYVLALSDFSEEAGFVDKLVGCFAEGQTDAELIAAVNAAFGTNLSVDEFTKVMSAIRAVYISTAGYIDPSTKNNLDLVQWAKNAHSRGWGYVWGTYGQVLTRSLYKAKAEQYPDEVGGYADFIEEHWIGGRTADCVGLIKGYGWFDPETGKIEYGTNGMPDIGADTMYANAEQSGTIDTIPEIPGLAVWHEGHIGIYIGNGHVIHASGTKVGVIQTPIGNSGWTHWLKIPYITYYDSDITEAPDEDHIWEVLYARIGNPYGVAGLMGNLYAESGLQPNNLQNSYEESLGYSDASYTQAVDSGSYSNFTSDSAGYDVQRRAYTDKINGEPGWTMVGIYADKGITGTSVKKRDDFNRLMRHCKQGKVDMIITKSVARFARNTLDCLKHTRMLKEHNVDVYFEEQGIHSIQPGAEFYITIYGSIAQSESENISANVRWGKAQSAKEGNVPFHYKRFLGYRRGSDGKPEIDPEQAVVVKRIYERFLAGDSLATIANDLNTDGIPTPSGVGKWQRGTIESILTNEKYKGDAILNKTYIRDCLSKKVMINNGERPKYYVENNHPAIIDSATFGRVQEEMARRCGKRKVKQVGTKTEQGRYSSKYALTELLICGECGTPYRRCTWAANGKKKVVWRCINRLDYGKKYCHDSPSIEESVLQEAIMKAVLQTAKQNADVLKTLKLHIGMGLSAETTEDNSLDLQIRIAEVEAEFQKMLKAIAADNVEAFDEEKAKALMDEKAKLQIQLDRIADTKQKRKNAKSRLDEIFTIIEALANHPISYDDQIVRQILESVIVESKEKIKVVFVGGLEVTQTM